MKKEAIRRKKPRRRSSHEKGLKNAVRIKTPTGWTAAAAVASAGVLPDWKPAPVGAGDGQLPVDAVRVEGPLHA